MSDKPIPETVRPVATALGLQDDYQFDSTRVKAIADLPRLTDLRVREPAFLTEALAARPRRDALSPDGRLVILAADHPARMVTAVGDDPARMGNRADYLARIVRVLQASPIDGLMATPDLIEDVVALDALARKKGNGFLGQRVLLGSMNRSGVQGAHHELWDMPSTYLHARDLIDANLDGGKVLWRYTPDGEANKECLQTMVATAQLVAECAAVKLPIFIEPLAVENRSGKWALSQEANAWIAIIGAASSLGPSTARTWLKIPFLRPYEPIVAATSLPILMLGGPATGVPASLLVDFHEGMHAGHNVRGALVGRNILYPGADDPAVIARAVCHVVHDGMSAEEASRLAGRAGRM